MSIDTSASTAGRLDEHERLRTHVEGVRERADRALPWGPETVGIPAPAVEDALLRLNDVAFYANARQEVAAFAECCLTLLALHRPRDAGGISSASTPAALRCNCCMLRWPCPTVGEMNRLLR